MYKLARVTNDTQNVEVTQVHTIKLYEQYKIAAKEKIFLLWNISLTL